MLILVDLVLVGLVSGCEHGILRASNSFLYSFQGTQTTHKQWLSGVRGHPKNALQFVLFFSNESSTVLTSLPSLEFMPPKKSHSDGTCLMVRMAGGCSDFRKQE